MKMRTAAENSATTLPAICDYATECIAQRLDKMLSHLEGVRHSEETEPVHQMRVWSRRSRAALDIFHDCFPRKKFAQLEREIKAVTGALGAARDLDVMIETLRKRTDALPPEQRPGLEAFVAKLQQQRKESQKSVEKVVTRLERQDLAHRFEALAQKRAERQVQTSWGDDHG